MQHDDVKLVPHVSGCVAELPCGKVHYVNSLKDLIAMLSIHECPEICTVCGKPVQMQSFKNTGFCCGNCKEGR